jgi:UDP-N-acetylglucosamine 1-carboxyvinyltransferase
MASFEIVGGRKLRGDIVPQGAKNEALQVLCAVLLTSEKVRIEHVPDIRDVNKLIDLLKLLGVSVREMCRRHARAGAPSSFRPTR